MSSEQASHEPSPGELAHESGAAAGHADDHGSDDHAGEALGPVDVQAWGALIVGAGAGLIVALCLVITTALMGSNPA